MHVSFFIRWRLQDGIWWPIYKCIPVMYGAVCVQLTYSSLNDREDICDKSSYHLKIGYINCLHCYHLIIIIKQTCLKALKMQNAYNVYSVECVSHISPFFQLPFMQYMRLGVYSLPIVRVFVLHFVIIIKSAIRIINHGLGLSHKTTVCDVCQVII